MGTGAQRVPRTAPWAVQRRHLAVDLRLPRRPGVHADDGRGDSRRARRGGDHHLSADRAAARDVAGPAAHARQRVVVPARGASHRVVSPAADVGAALVAVAGGVRRGGEPEQRLDAQVPRADVEAAGHDAAGNGPVRRDRLPSLRVGLARRAARAGVARHFARGDPVGVDRAARVRARDAGAAALGQDQTDRRRRWSDGVRRAGLSRRALWRVEVPGGCAMDRGRGLALRARHLRADRYQPHFDVLLLSRQAERSLRDRAHGRRHTVER